MSFGVDAPLLAIDWGTTSLRGAWMSSEGEVLEERALAAGVQGVAPGQFRAAFDAAFGDWWARPGARGLISGMAGSRQGWIEAPYCACPNHWADLARAVTWIEPSRLAIVPGLSCEHDGVPDVMRGEEVQVLGAARRLELVDQTLVLPGTHSKWVRLRAARVEDFVTVMTGEVYALLRQRSILARTLPSEEDSWHAGAFDEGVACAWRASGLLQSAFSVRTLSLTERLPLPHRLSYLSGLVIGEELRCRQAAEAGSVVLVGAPALTQRYARAFAGVGVQARVLGETATWQGLYALAREVWP